MKRFLIVKTSSIGDVIQSFHLIPYLKGRFPRCEIDWVVEKEITPLLRAHPDLARILEIDTKLWRKGLFQNRCAIATFRNKLRQYRYDALFDLQGSTKSACITGFARAKKKVGYGWKTVPEKTSYFMTNVHLPCQDADSVRDRYSQLLLDFFGDEHIEEAMHLELKLEPEEESYLQRLEQLGFQRPRLMICFGSNWKNKQLTEETLIAFLHLIREKCCPTFFFIHGNDGEREIADRLEREFSGCSHTVGGVSLPLWQRFMGKVDAIIAMDSAALHLCATTNTPSFSLFGPSSAQAYKPTGNRHHAFQGTCPYAVEFKKRCPYLRSCHTGACLRQVSVDALFSHFETFWDTIQSSLLTPVHTS